MTRNEQRRRRKRVRRVVLLGALAVVIAGVVIIAVRRGGEESDAEAAGRDRTYTVRQVSDRQTVEVSGNVQPLDARNYSFSVSRALTAVAVQVGQRVRPGDVLAQVDDTQERYNLANLDLSIEEERLSGSQRRLAVLQLQRELRVDELQQTVLRADITGTVVEIGFDPGERVSPGAAVVRVIDTSALVAEVEINEYDVPLLSPGMPVEFRFDAFPDETYVGTLSRLSLEGRVNQQGLAVVDAQIRLNAPDPRIIPSYSFLADIVVTEAQEVLAVEQSALFQGPRQTVVLLISGAGERPVPTPVETEPLGDGLVRIVSGVEAGAVLADPVALREQGESTGGAFLPGAGARPGGGAGGGAGMIRPPAGGGN